MTVHEKAYAKINLHLNVTAKRQDGFHDIETVMQTVSLCDELAMSLAPSDRAEAHLSICGADLPTDRGNIVRRAAELYLARSGKIGRIDISLVKRIPVAAGLAGGSADAAATLRALNRLFNSYFSESELFALAAELGSDVPFCLLGGRAVCRGRGELIEPVFSPTDLHFVIAIADGEQVSTPAAFRALDEMYSNFDGSIGTDGAEKYKNLLSDLSSGNMSQDSLFNIFEAAVLPECPKAQKIKEEMRTLGAYATLMSGSGPSVYGIFDSEKGALDACDKFKQAGLRAYFATTV